MMTTRRTFIRQVGVSLAATLTSGCMRTCYTPAPPTQMPTPTCYVPAAPTLTPDVTDSRWRDLRACWLGLRDRRFEPGQSVDGDRYARAEELGKTLHQRHQAALDALVADGSLSAEVAAEIGVAFEEALNHLQSKLATCYAPLAPGEANPYPPREDLNAQAAALAEMAQRSNIDQATVAKAQAALERDIAWLAEFHATRQAGDINTIAASPAEIEAASILVELLLGKKRTTE